METLTLIQQQLENYSNLGDVVIMASASASNVSVADILSKSKNKEVTMARASACHLLSEHGFGVREISRLTTTDPKGVHTYIHTHDNRMADNRFERVYMKAKRYAEDYYSSDMSLREDVERIKNQYAELASKYEHLKELITSN